MKVNIKGLNKAEVLAILYNNSKLQGLGFLNKKEGTITIEEASELLNKQTYFDYLYGKVMKIDLSSDDEFDSTLYDRYNGEGSAEFLICILMYQKNNM